MTETLRLLRALGWLRWRQVAGSLRGGRRRDAWERLARWGAVVVPAALLVVLVAMSLALAAAAFVGGRAAARGDEQATIVLLTVLRILLGAATFAVFIAPLLDATRGTGGLVARLALLPIPRRLLHVSEVLAAAVDPWLLLVSIPCCLGLPAGLAAGGRPLAGLVACAAGVAFVAALAALSATLSLGFAILLRDRRRGETVRMIVLLAVTIGGFTPLLFHQAAVKRREATVPAEEERERRMRLRLPPWAAGAPSELHASALDGALQRAPASALGGLAGLLAWGAGLFAISGLVHARLLATPASSGGRARGGAVFPRAPRLPLLTGPQAAIALALARLVMRTVRGKMAVLAAPVVMAVAGALLVRLRGEALPFALGDEGGAAVAAFAVPACLLSLDPVLMNAFGAERAGLTLQLLHPLTARDLLRGKAGGAVLLGLAGTTVAALLSLLLSPTGPPAAWLTVPVSAAGALLVLAPLGLLVSLLFPKAANLSMVGREGNAHPLASALGLVAVALACGPPFVLAAIGRTFLGGEWAGLGLAAAWLPVAFLLCTLLLAWCEPLLDARRENLGLVAQGR